MNEALLKVYTEDIAALVKAAAQKFASGSVEGDGRFKFIMSTGSVDRDGDVVSPDGWLTDAFLKNPVVLWAHNYSLPPIGAIDKIEKNGNEIHVEGVFARDEFAQRIRKLYDDGIVSAMSPGFIVKERQGKVITKQELLECSIVPVPANSEAVTLRSIADVQEVATKMLGEQKGQVQDVLEAREAQTYQDVTEKWEDIDEVYAVIYALNEVYLRPETSPDAFKDLLLEAISLLQSIADEETLEDQGAVASAVKAFHGKLKAGRVLSAANVKKIQTAMDGILDVHGCLKELVDLTEGDKAFSSKTKATETDRLQGVDLDVALSAVRSIDKACEHALVLMKTRGPGKTG